MRVLVFFLFHNNAVGFQIRPNGVGLMPHVPDDYDERDKYLRTEVYNIEETLYAGECKDVVKLKNGEWNACPETRKCVCL